MEQPPSARRIWLSVLWAAAWCAVGIWTRFENRELWAVTLGAILMVGASKSQRIEEISEPL